MARTTKLIEGRVLSVPAVHTRCIVNEEVAAEIKEKGRDNVALERYMKLTSREDTPITINGWLDLCQYDEYRGFRYIAYLHYLEKIGEFIRLSTINSVRWSPVAIHSIDEFLALPTDGLGVSYGFGVVGEIEILPWQTDDAVVLAGMAKGHPKPFLRFDGQDSNGCERFRILSAALAEIKRDESIQV